MPRLQRPQGLTGTIHSASHSTVFGGGGVGGADTGTHTHEREDEGEGHELSPSLLPPSLFPKDALCPSPFSHISLVLGYYTLGNR